MRKMKPEFLFLKFSTLILILALSVSLQAQNCGIPVLYNVPQDIFIDCGDDLPAWPTVTASDLCGAVTVTREQSVTGSKCGTYVYVRIWTAAGVTGTTTARQHIRFHDTTPPVLVVPEDTVVQCGEPLPAPEVYSDDACSWVDTKLEVSITEHNECEYTMVRTWTAKDGCGNSTQKKQVIEVVDTLAPVIEVVNPKLKDIEFGEEIAVYDCESPQVYLSDIKVTDCCAELDIEAYDQLLINGKCDKFGFYRKWKCGYTATDDAGNTSEFYFFMVLYDEEAPVLYNVPDDIILECGEAAPEYDPDLVTASDNCTRRTRPEFTEEIAYDPSDSSNFAIRRSWYFEDDCGNSVEDYQWILSCLFDTTMVTGDSTMQDSMMEDSTVGGSAPLTIGNSGSGLFEIQEIAKQKLDVFPNPTTGYTSIRFNVNKGELFKIQVLDKLGRTVLSNVRQYDKGDYTESLDLSPFPAGFYSIIITGENGTRHANLIKTE